jgi:hypothetical protein
MSEKINAVQLNEAELDQVVGGKDVLSLQGIPAENSEAAAGCLSWVSCSSSVSGRSAELEYAE